MSMRLRLPNVRAAMAEAPWAILPSKLDEITAVVMEHAQGGSMPPRVDPYAARREQMKGAARGAVAVVPIYGALVPRAGLMTEYSGGTSAESVASQVAAAASNPAVGTIVLDVDSPGGSVMGIAEAAAAIRAAAASKRVVAVVDTMAASAAYWLASQATEIVASESSLSGNIGVIMTILDTSEADAKAGIKPQVISAGKYKAEGAAGLPLSEDAVAALQAMVDDYYAQFVTAVASGRGVTPAAVRTGFGEGRILTATQAVAAGVVDRIGTLESVLAELGSSSQSARMPMRADAAPADIAARAAAASPTLSVEATASGSHLSLISASQPRSTPVEHDSTTAAAGAAPSAASIAAAERKRVTEILSLAAEHGVTDTAVINGWVDSAKTVDAVGLDILKQKRAASADAVVTSSGRVAVGETRETQKPFATFGEFIRATRNAELAPQSIDPRLLPLRAAGIGLQEGVGSDGGFLIPLQYAQGIMDRAFAGGELMSRVRRVPMQGNRYVFNAIDETSRATGSRWGGIQGFWVGEGVSPTASKPRFRQGTLDLKKLSVLAYVTEEQMEDASATASILEQGMTEEVIFLTESAIFEGTGAGTPAGFLTSGALVTQAAVGGQTAGTIVQANVSAMWSRLWARSRGNAVWLVHQDAEAQFDGMTVGNWPVFLPPGGLSQSSYGLIKNRPVIATEYNSALGTVGDIVLADLSQYILGERRGQDLQRSMHVRFLQGEEAFRLTYRVDGQPLWVAPLTPNKGANTVSPFIALAAR